MDADTEGIMRAATMNVDITPHGKFWMEGYIHPSRQEPSTEVHDAPQAILLLVEQDGAEVLFVSVDVCILGYESSRPMREGLAQVLGIDPDHIVINSIHSHSCVNGFEDGTIMGIPTTPGYVSMVTGRVVEAATQLRDAMVEATPEMLVTHVRGWYSNRNDADLPFDDEVFVLRFRTAEGKTAGALLNFNCHATVVGPLNHALTTDVIGGVRAEVAEWIGCVPYTFTGASGDLGNRQFRRGNDFAELRRVSNGIAGVIMDGAFEPVELSAPTVRTFMHHVKYNNEDFYPEYERQLAEVNELLAGNPTFDEIKLATTEKEALEQQLERHEMEFDIRMVVVDFGSVAFATFPGELASALGAMVKKSVSKNGAHPVVVGYANDYQGYFVPASTFGGTSYESYVTQMPKGWIEDVLEEFDAWA